MNLGFYLTHRVPTLVTEYKMDIYIEHFHHKKNKINKHPTKKERREEKKSNYLLIENTECPRHRCAGPVRDREKLDELNDNFFSRF